MAAPSGNQSNTQQLGTGQASTEEESKSEGFRMKFSSSEVLSRLNDFRLSNQFCDIKIIVENTEFHAHRVVLAAISPYFKAMFSGQFCEALQSEVRLETIEADVMKIILDYAYSNIIDVDTFNVGAILHAANFFQTEPLFSACCNYLEKNLTAENCFSVWGLASEYSYQYPELEEKAKNFAISNFSAACRVNDFLELDRDAVVHIIKSDSLNVEREEVVFEAIARWLAHKRHQRFNLFDTVLCHVRLGLLDPMFLYDWAQALELYKSDSCMKLVDEARKYHLMPSRRSDVSFSLLKLRRSSVMSEVLLIHCESDDESFLNCLNRDGDIVKQLTYAPDDCRSLVSSSYSGIIIACCLDTMWLYNIASDDGWMPIAPNLKSRCFFGLCELDGSWYSFGGRFVGGRTCDTVEKYDTSKNAWKQMASMPVAVSYPAVVCHEGKILVLGGLTKNNVAYNRVQRYDPRCNSWTILMDLPVAVKFPAACIVDKTIHLFNFLRGGEGQRVHYTYNLSTNKWSLRSLSGHFAAGPVCMDGSVYVLAKYRVDAVTDRYMIMRYLPSTDSWVQFGDFTSSKPKLFGGPLIVEKELL